MIELAVDLLFYEKTLLKAGHSLIAGVDEAGRGAWAGPVTAAAVILPLDHPALLEELHGVRDSKLCTPQQRDKLYELIRKTALSTGVGAASAEEIDRLGIVAASRLAMKRAIEDLHITPQALLIDGGYMWLPEVHLPQKTLVKGELKSLSIAAASIIAKVERDRHMTEQDKRHPGYSFAQHKGYGTPRHQAALANLGLCELHRRSFAPIRREIDRSTSMAAIKGSADSTVGMRIALVHDWLNQRGGAENVLETLVALYPGAPIYTSMYAPERMPASYRGWDIRTTWMDRLPGIHTHHQPYLPLYPAAFEQLDLSGYEVVLSNKSGFCHGVQTGEALHICYCLAPTRYVWQYNAYVERESLPAATAAILKPLIAMLRRWDYQAAQRVDHFIAISSEIRERIRRFYNRDSVIIYPPVETQRYQPVEKPDDYYLVVARLIPYKRIDLAVRACTRLGLPLLVGGDGRDRERLEAMAGPTVQFLGRVPDEDMPDLMARCKAFIFPGLEDFGIAPVEAQAAGRPVIAFRGGGALDTIIEGETGLFFDEQRVESLETALKQFQEMFPFSSARCRANAERFDTAVFKRELTTFVAARYDEYRRRG